MMTIKVMNGQIHVNGPLHNKVLCMEMLADAIKVVAKCQPPAPEQPRIVPGILLPEITNGQ